MLYSTSLFYTHIAMQRTNKLIKQTIEAQQQIILLPMIKLLLITLITIFTVNANAQTQYQIQTNSTDLKSEHKKELDKWMLLAYGGDPEAQFKVGVLYANDQFDNPDLEQAVYWYKQAARQGHALAQYNLGHHFLAGTGVEQNEASAIEWWMQAAKNDHALAQFNIGRAYYLGIGVPEDHTQSRYWLERAAQNQEPKSIEILQQLGWNDGTVVSSNNNDTVTQNQIPDFDEINNPNAGSEADQKLESRITPTIDVNTQANSPVEQPNPVPIPEIEPEPIEQAKPQTTATVEPAEQATTVKIVTTPVALYTNPAVRSVLITIVENRESLEIIDTNKDWVTVKSPTGLPVWMHSDFLQVSGDVATVTGSNVNARSVPIISAGTIVGKLNKGQQVKVIDEKNDWYRVLSPADFTAWVKTDDYNNHPSVISVPTE